jgi:hypothetical protein
MYVVLSIIKVMSHNPIFLRQAIMRFMKIRFVHCARKALVCRNSIFQETIHSERTRYHVKTMDVNPSLLLLLFLCFYPSSSFLHIIYFICMGYINWTDAFEYQTFCIIILQNINKFCQKYLKRSFWSTTQIRKKSFNKMMQYVH